MTEPRVFVHIVSYKSSALVRDCVASLVDEPVDQIVVLENDSGTSERETLRRLADEWGDRVQVHFADQNLGFGGGHNLLLSLSTARDDDIIWMLNPDTRVREGSTASLARVASESACLVSPLITYVDTAGGRRVWFAGGEFDAAACTVAHMSYGAEVVDVDVAREVDFLTGAAVMGAARVWRRLQGFDQRYFLYWEDVELSVRARRAGIRLFVDGSAEVVHLEGGSTGGPRSSLYHYYNNRNRVLLAREEDPSWRPFRGPARRATLGSLRRTWRPVQGGWSRFRAAAKGIRHGVRDVVGRVDY